MASWPQQDRSRIRFSSEDLLPVLEDSVRLCFSGWHSTRHLLAVVPIMHQPQTQLVQLGTKSRVHVLRAEGRLVFREAPPPRPGGQDTRLSCTGKRLLWFSDFAHFQELQKAFDTSLAEPRLRAVTTLQRLLENGLQPAESTSQTLTINPCSGR